MEEQRTPQSPVVPEQPTAAPSPQQSTGASPALPGAFSLFTPSLDAFKVNLGTFIALLLSPFVIGLACYLVFFIGAAAILGSGGKGGGLVAVLMLLVGLAITAISLIFGPALIYAQLKSVQKQPVEFMEAIKVGVRYMGKYFVLSLIVGLITMIGLLLFIVPGLFMLKRYLLAPYYLIDKNLGVLEAMKQCAADSKRFSGAVWGVVGVQILVSLSCVIPVVGIILWVMYLCAPAIRYYQIKQAVGLHAA